jgi:hypothetical protein
MKKISTILLLFATTFVFAQETININLGDFSELKVFSGLKIQLEKSDSPKIVITGSKADQVSVKNKNGSLKISLKFPDGLKNEDINITLYYSKDIAVLDANEGSYITSKEVINQQNLELKVQEGANIDFPLAIKYLTAKAVSGGVILISGTTENQTVEVTSGGVYKAFDVQSKLTFATASSGGSASITVNQMLDAKVNLGGSIYYTGTPEELKTKKVIGGTIKQVD